MSQDRNNSLIAMVHFLQTIGKPILMSVIGLLYLLFIFLKFLKKVSLQLKKVKYKFSFQPQYFIRFLLKKTYYKHLQIRRKIAVNKHRITFLAGKSHLRFPKLFSDTPGRYNKILKPSLAIFTLILLSLSFLSYFYILKDLPHPKDLISIKPAVSTKIYARDGRLLYKVYEGENRSIVSLSDIPAEVVHATIAIEDSDFYQHAGFSIKGIVRALKRNITHDSLQGGSTITQQLIKTTLLTPEKTLQRKLKELILAVAVESYFTKDEILAMYFNQVGYGGPNYGIEEAAQYYFGKSVNKISLAEAALLAGLPAAPTIFSPFGARPELAIARQHEVLRRMAEDGYLTSSQAESAKNQPLTFASPTHNIQAPHFVMYVKDLLAKRYGEEAVVRGGMEVTTSIDLDIQELAQKAVDAEILKLKSLNVTNAAVLVTSPKTGEILAMVGSHNYFDTASDGQVNVTLRERQPGSSIKPITYALALENGFTPATIIDDSPVTYRLPGSDAYTPKNYDGRTHGRVTLRQALANSYNISAVKTLYTLGVSKLINKARDMGITTWNAENRYGLSLTLGGGEVKMIDMAVVYGSLANSGKRVDLRPILYVTDFTGTKNDNLACGQNPRLGKAAPAYAASNDGCEGKQVVKSEVAYLISDILADNKARSSAFGTHSLLEIPGKKVSVKTGTTNSLRDNWAIGYTPDYLVAVWVGNNDNTPMSRVASGVTGATPIWNQIMTALVKNTPPASAALPENLVEATICPMTGTLTCAACPNPKTELIQKDLLPQTACNDAMLAPFLTPSPAPESPQPIHSTTYVLPIQPDPSPTRAAPDFTSPFSGRINPLKPPRPLR